jgi:iron complex outermembrane receptor protein
MMIRSQSRLGAFNCVSIAVLAVAVAQSARAQTASTAPGSMVQEVIVTAEKREVPLERTPLAVTAFSHQQVERLQLKNIRQLEATIPGLVFGESSNISQVTLRGIGNTFTSVGAESGVATYVDGVYQGRTFLQSQDNPAIDHIEVLRGPQGTLYGRNTTGGVINFYTELPTFSPQVGAQVIVGNYDRVDLQGWAAGPIYGDKVAARLDLSRETRDGYVDNLLTSRPYDDLASTAARLSVVIKPTDNVEFVLRGHDSNLLGGTPAYEIRNLLPGSAGPLNPDPFSSFAPPVDTHTSLAAGVPAAGLIGPDPWHQYYNAPAHNQVTNAGANAEFKIELGNITVKSLTAYEQYHQNVQLDLDGTSADWFREYVDERSHQVSEELNVLGSSFGGRLNWVGGFFYLDDHAHGVYLDDLPGQAAYFDSVFELTAGGAPDWTLSTPLYGPVRDYPWLQEDYVQDLRSYAVYGQATLSLTTRLRLIGGIRYTDDKKEVVYSEVTQIAPSCSASIDGPWKVASSAVTPKVGVEYDVAPRQMIYASVTNGYKGGGVNAFTCGQPNPAVAGAFLGNAYGPEKVWAYEGGYKAEFFERKLIANLAAFYYDYKDVQVENLTPNGELITNAGSARIYGVEGELIARPTPALTMTASAGYLNARYDSGPAVDPFTNAALPDGLAGKAMPLSPSWKGSATISYLFDLGRYGTLSPELEGSYSSRYFFDALNTPHNDQSAYGLVNARLTYDPTRRVELDLFVLNLANQLHWDTSSPSSFAWGGIAGTPAPPRTFGLRLRWKLY